MLQGDAPNRVLLLGEKLSYTDLPRRSMELVFSLPTRPEVSLSILCAQPRFAGPDDGVCSVGDLQLGEDVGNMVAYGSGA
jgi:hypothetical protein